MVSTQVTRYNLYIAGRCYCTLLEHDALDKNDGDQGKRGTEGGEDLLNQMNI